MSAFDDFDDEFNGECGYQKVMVATLNEQKQLGEYAQTYAGLYEAIVTNDLTSVKKYSEVLSLNGMYFSTIQEVRSPLKHAIENSSLELVQLLLDLGADPYHQVLIGYGYAYGIALSAGRADVIKELVKRGVPLEDSDSYATPLMAFLTNHTNDFTGEQCAAVKAYIEAGINLAHQDPYTKETAYSIAEEKGYLGILRRMGIELDSN